MRLKEGAATPEAVTDSAIRVNDFAVSAEGDRVVLMAYRPHEKNREPRAALFLIDLRTGPAVVAPPLIDDPAVSFSTPAFTP